MNRTVQAHAALFTVALIYGANYSIAKLVMNGGYIKPLGFILLRGLTATALFWIFHRIFIREKIEKKDLPRLVACGLFGVAINQMFFFSGLELTTPINASLIMTTTPMLVLIASALMIGERVTAQKIIGILIGATGAGLLIAYGHQVQFSRSGLWGDVLILINATSYGIYLVLAKKLLEKYNAITVVKWIFTFGLLFILPFGSKQFLAVDWNTFTTPIWISTIYVLLATTFLAYLLNAFALKLVNPTVVSIYIYLQPLFATGIALFMAKDLLTPIKVISGLLIFTGVFLVSQRRKPQTS